MVFLLCGPEWKRTHKGHNATARSLKFCPGGSCPPALTLVSHTSMSPYLPLVPFQLLPWCWSQREWVCISPKSTAGPSRRDFWESCSFFSCHNSHWFLQPEVMGSYLPGTGNLGCMFWFGAAISCSQGTLPDFYLPQVGVWLPILHLCASVTHVSEHLCVSAPPTHLHNVTPLIPWLLDFHTAQFSDNSGR